MKYNSILRNALVLLPLVFLYSCAMHVKSTYVLNPDMSGKCIVEEKVGLDVAEITGSIGNADPKKLYSGMDSYFTDTSKKSSHDILMGFASKMLSSKGIETWNNVQFGMIGKDTVYFKGTAYFKDITAISLSAFDTIMEVTKNADGETIIRLKQKTATRQEDSAKLASMSEASKYTPTGGLWSAMMHYYMAAFLRGLDVELSYQVPGKITSYSNFEKRNNNTVCLHLTDVKIIAGVDSLMTSQAMGLMEFSKSSNPYAYNSLFYGENKPLQVTFKSNSEPSFDYSREVADAKKYYVAFRRSSGIERFDSVRLAMERQKEEEALREHGTLVLTVTDSANNKVYFKTLGAEQYYGMLSFSGQLSKPLPTSYYSKINITKAYDDRGNNIIDSIQNRDNISAYLSPTTYTYTDSIPHNDKVTFSLSPNLPEDCKMINIEGSLTVSDSIAIPFKIVKLYLKPRDKSGIGNEGKY
ncbi:MAG TPA: hypothetical protein VK806_02940 [Bacteroidia bacterium]|jgi:hypothetical protein|nr:hypothetical protein [Bacteroidia bacterium]